MKKLILLLCLSLTVISAAGAKKKEKQQTPQLSTLQLIEKVNNLWQQNNQPETRAFGDDAVYHIGNMEACRLTGKAQWLEYSDKWARHNKWRGAHCGNKKMWAKTYKTYGEDEHHVLFGDWQACFQTYLDLYETAPASHKIARTREVMNQECALPQTDFWWWADALYMVMPVMTKLYKQTDDATYLIKLYQNFLYTDSLMWDKDAHLYYHDGKSIYPQHKTNKDKKDFTAQSNGKVLAALAKVLQDMPTSFRFRAIFVERFKQLAEAVAQNQQKDGSWAPSILDAAQAKDSEINGTAFIAYGLYWGINHGIIDRSVYEPVALKAWEYISEKTLQQPANATKASMGAFLLAACERLRYEDSKEAQPVTIIVRNDSPNFRQEVVEIDAKTVFEKLAIQGGRQFKIFNAVKQEIAYQLTHDGKLLIDAAVRPCGTATFIIKKGTPRPVASTCYGRMYPERVDDIAWENDRGAYRLYGPALQKSGERAFGNDVWVKNTPDLDVESRYYVEDINKPRIAKLKEQGNIAAADSLEELTTYHFDHGHGLDCYKVGPSLGCGTPALMDGNRIIFPYCYKEYELLDNGPLRFTVSLTYHPTDYKGETVTEHRILSLDKGSNFNKQTVWYEGALKPVDIASGVVVHNEDTSSVVVGKDFVQYADPTDNPTGQNFQIYVAALFPDGVSETKQVENEGHANGIAGHALGIKRSVQPNEKLTYYFGSSWSKFDCRTQAEWQKRIDGFMQAIHAPLIVEIK